MLSVRYVHNYSRHTYYTRSLAGKRIASFFSLSLIIRQQIDRITDNMNDNSFILSSNLIFNCFIKAHQLIFIYVVE